MNARVLITSVAILAATLASTLASTAASTEDPLISVREADGVYLVSARFSVPGSPSLAREVLTDYPNIPRFMPDVLTSEVIERGDGYVRVEQAAVSKYMMFSKRVRLVLDVEEGADVIRFRDRSHESFELYEGSWTIGTQESVTLLTYELTAKPAFSVPGFVLRKLLNRDAHIMIDRLGAEIGARAQQE